MDEEPDFYYEDITTPVVRDISLSAGSELLDVTIEDFKVGNSEYRLFHKLAGYYVPATTSPLWRLSVQFRQQAPKIAKLGELSNLTGVGETREQSLASWQYRVDRSIQYLLSLQDFERDQSENEAWNFFSNYFDLSATRYSSPLTLKCRGTFESASEGEFSIRWNHGEIEFIERENVPSEMAGYLVGQVFDATVHRCARTFDLIRVLSSERIEPEDISDAEALQILQASR